jgi:hypothetical protein
MYNLLNINDNNKGGAMIYLVVTDGRKSEQPRAFFSLGNAQRAAALMIWECDKCEVKMSDHPSGYYFGHEGWIKIVEVEVED